MISDAWSQRSLMQVYLLVGLTACFFTGQAASKEEPTPKTRTLALEEESQILERDWLYQAMGEPLLERTAQEITWSRELAQRLARQRPTPDLSAELHQLADLEKRLNDLRQKPVREHLAPKTAAVPVWIWFPEGKPAEDAPAATRFFRYRFSVTAKIKQAELRIAADDACEVFLNGTRLGTHDTWQQTKMFFVSRWLKPGQNVLAVRAENRPAPAETLLA